MRLNNNPYKRNWSGGAVQCRKKAGCLKPPGVRRQTGGLEGTTMARTRSNISHHMNDQRQPTQMKYFLNQGQTGKPRKEAQRGQATSKKPNR